MRGDRNGMAMGPATNRAARDRITPRLVGPSNTRTRKLHQLRHRVTVIYVPSNLMIFLLRGKSRVQTRVEHGRSERSFFQSGGGVSPSGVTRKPVLKSSIEEKMEEYSLMLRRKSIRYVKNFSNEFYFFSIEFFLTSNNSNNIIGAGANLSLNRLPLVT